MEAVDITDVRVVFLISMLFKITVTLYSNTKVGQIRRYLNLVIRAVNRRDRSFYKPEKFP